VVFVHRRHCPLIAEAVVTTNREAAYHAVAASTGPFHPAITVITQNIAEIGRRAAERVLARIGADVFPARRYVVKSTFIANGSGETPVTDSRRKADVRRGHIPTDNRGDRMEP